MSKNFLSIFCVLTIPTMYLGVVAYAVQKSRPESESFLVRSTQTTSRLRDFDWGGVQVLKRANSGQRRNFMGLYMWNVFSSTSSFRLTRGLR